MPEGNARGFVGTRGVHDNKVGRKGRTSGNKRKPRGQLQKGDGFRGGVAATKKMKASFGKATGIQMRATYRIDEITGGEKKRGEGGPHYEGHLRGVKEREERRDGMGKLGKYAT